MFSINHVSFGEKLLNICLFMYILSVVILSKSTELAIYSKIFGIILTLIFLIQYFFIDKRRIVFPLELSIFFIFIIYQAFSFYWADVPEIVLKQTVTLLQLLILSTIIVNICHKKSSIFIIYFPLLLGLYYTSMGVHSDLGLFVGLGQKNLRISGVLNNANIYAISIIVCVLFGIIIYNQKKRSIFHYILILLSIFLLYDLLLTGSRKGLVAFILIVIVNFSFLSAFSRSTLPKKIKFISISLVACSIFLVSIYNSPYFRRFEESYNYAFGVGSSVKTMDQRGYLVRAAFGNWKESPVVGKGTGQFRYTESLPLNMRYYYAHNNYVEVLSNNGLIGFCLYYSIYVSLLLGFLSLRVKNCDVDREKIINICLCTVFILMFWDIGMVSYYEKFIWLLLSVLIYLKYSMSKSILNYE